MIDWAVGVNSAVPVIGLIHYANKLGHRASIDADGRLACSACGFYLDFSCMAADQVANYVTRCMGTGAFEYRRPTLRELLEGRA